MEISERLSGKKQPNWDKIDTGIEWKGRGISLPADPAKMPLPDARAALDRKIRDENQDYQVGEWIDGFPHDAAVAFTKACRNLYGLSSPVSTWFSDPTMLTVKTGWRREEFVQVALGLFQLPGVDKQIQTSFAFDNKKNPGMWIAGVISKKDREIILEIANETRRIIKDESIYRGKAISIEVDDHGNLMLNEAPDFLNVEDTTEASVLFNGVIEDQIKVNLLIPLLQAESCRQHKVPLRRNVLLTGRFGTGKSLTARMVANVAQRKGEWTYILLDRVQGLTSALRLAKRYSPCVVFAEDIDRITEERDNTANDLINTISGVVGKDDEIMVLLSTNHPERINQAMLRPGRLDAIIELKEPEPETVERLLRFYAGNLIPADASLTEAGKELAGQIPSTIREAVSRATLSMVGRGAAQFDDHDLFIAARSMGFQLELLNRNLNEKSLAEKFVETFQEVLGAGNGYDGSDKTVASARDVSRVHIGVRTVDTRTANVQKAVGADNVPDQPGLVSVNTKLNNVHQRLDHLQEMLERMTGIRPIRR